MASILIQCSALNSCRDYGVEVKVYKKIKDFSVVPAKLLWFAKIVYVHLVAHLQRALCKVTVIWNISFFTLFCLAGIYFFSER